MKKLLPLIIFFFATLICPAFGQTQPRIAEKNCTIEIFLVESGNIDSAYGCRYCFTPSIKDLAGKPFIENSEIIGYEITSDSIHTILLSESAIQRLRKYGRTPPPFSSTAAYPFYFTSRAFAIVVNGQPIYGGWFRNSYLSSNTFADWVIIPTPFDKDWNGKLRVNWGLKTPKQCVDPRNNKLLLECLKNSNRYIVN